MAVRVITSAEKIAGLSPEDLVSEIKALDDAYDSAQDHPACVDVRVRNIDIRMTGGQISDQLELLRAEARKRKMGVG